MIRPRLETVTKKHKAKAVDWLSSRFLVRVPHLDVVSLRACYCEYVSTEYCKLRITPTVICVDGGLGIAKILPQIETVAGLDETKNPLA